MSWKLRSAEGGFFAKQKTFRA